MGVRKGVKVHPASFDLVLTLKDEVGFSYEDLSAMLGVTPSRVQQIVLQQRKVRQADANISAGDNEDSQDGTATA